MFSYGFYNSLNGDRKYNAEQMSSIFDGVIVDGIFENIGEIFATVPGSGLEVIVKTGRAWFKHTWSLNDTWMPLAIAEPDTYRNRIDAVVLEVNHDINVRKNEIKIITGEPAVVAAKPTMIHNENVDQYALAYVTVAPFATSILEDNIEIMVGRGDVPFVTCPLKTIPITDLFNQWNGEFSTWFNNLKAQLTDNVVTNLQSQITENKEQLDSIQSTLNGNLPIITDGMGAGSLFMVSKYYDQPIENAVLCNGGNISGSEYPELANMIGLAYGGTVSSTLVNSSYGVTSTYGYPKAYNQDRDFFVTASMVNKRIVIYKRNTTPQIISIPSTLSYISTAVNSDLPVAVISFDKYIFIRSTVYRNSSYSIAWWYYDIDTATWPTQGSGISTLTNSQTPTLIGNVLVSFGSSGTIGVMYRIDPTKHGALYVNIDGASTNSTIYPILDFDHADDEYAYFFLLTGSKICRAKKSTINSLVSSLTGGSSTLATELVASGSTNTSYASWCVRFDNYIYYGTNTACYSRSVNGSTVGAENAQYSNTSNTSKYASPIAGAIKVTDNVLIIFPRTTGSASVSSPNGVEAALTHMLICYKGKVTSQSTLYGTYGMLARSGNTVQLSTSGLRSDFALSQMTLPTISMSEALVYMRTKTPEKEA